MTRQIDTPHIAMPIDGRRGSGGLARTLLIGGAAVLIGAGIRSLLKATSVRSTVATDRLRDKTLKDSFPASDPPASQYFDIPVNRK